MKGLFCHVPYDSLEHVVMFGVGAAGDSSDDEENDLSVSNKMFEHEWAASVATSPLVDSLRTAGWGSSVQDGEKEAGGGRSRFKGRRERTAAAGDAVATASRREEPLQFPRAFSRYSTLEEERDYANNRNRDSRCRAGVGNHSLETISDTGKIWASQSGRAAGGADGGRGDGDASGLRLLALCRVMLGNTFVSSSPLSDFQTTARDGTRQLPEGKGIGARGDDSRDDSQKLPAESIISRISLPRPPVGQPEYDSVYFPREEEYVLLNQAFVLPEFLMVHRFIDQPSPPGPPGPPPPPSTGPSISNSAELQVENSAPPLAGPGSGAGAGAGQNDNSRDQASLPSVVSAGSHLHLTPCRGCPSSPIETAASVVEGMKAIISRCHVHGAAAKPESDGSVPPLSASRVVPGVHQVPPLAASLLLSYRSARGAVGGIGVLDFSSWNAKSVVADALTREAYRQRERGSGRESRDVIVRALEFACEGCCEQQNVVHR